MTDVQHRSTTPKEKSKSIQDLFKKKKGKMTMHDFECQIDERTIKLMACEVKWFWTSQVADILPVAVRQVDVCSCLWAFKHHLTYQSPIKGFTLKALCKKSALYRTNKCLSVSCLATQEWPTRFAAKQCPILISSKIPGLMRSFIDSSTLIVPSFCCFRWIHGASMGIQPTPHSGIQRWPPKNRWWKHVTKPLLQQ